MSKMRVVQISRAGGPLEFVERDIPAPGPGQVRVRVEANGICHSDVLTKEGLMPGIQYPRVPGHEAEPRLVDLDLHEEEAAVPEDPVHSGVER